MEGLNQSNLIYHIQGPTPNQRRFHMIFIFLFYLFMLSMSSYFYFLKKFGFSMYLSMTQQAIYPIIIPDNPLLQIISWLLYLLVIFPPLYYISLAKPTNFYNYNGQLVIEKVRGKKTQHKTIDTKMIDYLHVEDKISVHTYRTGSTSSGGGYGTSVSKTTHLVAVMQLDEFKTHSSIKLYMDSDPTKVKQLAKILADTFRLPIQ